MGSAEREFVAFTYRNAWRLRVIVMGACAVLGAVAMAGGGMTPAVLVGGLSLGWSLLCQRLQLRGWRPRAVVYVDATVLTLVCFSQELTVPESHQWQMTSWVLVATGVVCVTYQLTHPPVVGAVVATVVISGDLAGLVLDRPGEWTEALPTVWWLLVYAALARVWYQAVLRRCRATDEAVARAGAARCRRAVDSGRRAAEREHLATLHDTACATFLMASLPGGPVAPDLVREQARRDLERLLADRPDAGEVDLAALLHQEIGGCAGLTVRTRFGADLGTVPRALGEALRGATGEALRNVHRHAGVPSAEVTAERVDGRLEVVVRDHGAGFAAAPDDAHHRGLRESIDRRMRDVGGAASVASEVGRGTRVRLVVPGG